MLRFFSRFSVPLLVVSALVALEGVLRLSEPRLSGDVAQIQEAADWVRYASNPSVLGVLMVGNSLLAEGVDRAELEKTLEADLGVDISLAKITPDGTTPLEWRFLFRKLVLRPGNRPAALVLAFGPGHLWDRPGSTQVLRLAAHHVDGADVGLLFREELTDIESRGKFLTARIWKTYALRDRIQLRLLDRVLPYFREEREVLLRTPISGSGVDHDLGDLRNLTGLLNDAAGAGIPVILLPMPAPKPRPVEGPVETLSRKISVPILDVRGKASLEPDRFPDGEHLDSEGKRVFTEALGPPLARMLASAIESSRGASRGEASSPPEAPQDPHVPRPAEGGAGGVGE
jgi:hypothetical protein